MSLFCLVISGVLWGLKTDQAGYAGHTGIVENYDPHTRTGTLLNAYDTQKGFCSLFFNRNQTTNESNGLGVVGFYRPANRA
jgi:hypothetical protein